SRPGCRSHQTRYRVSASGQRRHQGRADEATGSGHQYVHKSFSSVGALRHHSTTPRGYTLCSDALFDLFGFSYALTPASGRTHDIPYSVGMLRRNLQEHARWTFWCPTTLLPISQCANANTEQSGKLPL